MRTIAITLAAILAMALATFAHGATFAVPQGEGGGVLPTIALVECMADENTRPAGQYCQAAYFCTSGEGGKGRLWQGLSSHNSSALTLVPSQTACTLKVGDPARVRFLNLADFAEYATSCRESDDCADYTTSEMLAGKSKIGKMLGGLKPSNRPKDQGGGPPSQDGGPPSPLSILACDDPRLLRAYQANLNAAYRAARLSPHRGASQSSNGQDVAHVARKRGAR